jgi:hypothetical protein
MFSQRLSIRNPKRGGAPLTAASDLPDLIRHPARDPSAHSLFFTCPILSELYVFPSKYRGCVKTSTTAGAKSTKHVKSCV